MSQTKAQVDKLLSNVSQKLKVDGLIADEVLPIAKSVQSSGKIGKYGYDHLRIERSMSGGRGQYRRVEATTRSSDSFLIEGHGLEGLVTKDDYRNVEQPFDAESDETEGLTSMIKVEKEYTLASQLTDSAVLTQYVALSGIQKWSDYGNSDPLANLSTGRKAIKAGCGAISNLVAIMSWEVWDSLRFHPQILDSLGFKDNRPGGLMENELAKALGVDRVLIGKGVYNSAKEGQTAVLAPIWGKHLILAVLPQAAQKNQVSLGWQVNFTGSGNMKAYKYAVNNPPESTGILVEDSYDFILTNIGAAYLIKDAVA